MTISIGIASFDPSEHAAEEDELVRAADHALYVAKTGGGGGKCVRGRRQSGATGQPTSMTSGCRLTCDSGRDQSGHMREYIA